MALSHQKRGISLLGYKKKAEKCSVSRTASALVYEAVLASPECKLLEGSDHGSFISVLSEFYLRVQPKSVSCSIDVP